MLYWSVRVSLSSAEVSFVSLGGWGERKGKRTGDDGTEMRKRILNRPIAPVIDFSLLFTVLFMGYHWEPLQRRESVLKFTFQLVVNLRNTKFVALRPLLVV